DVASGELSQDNVAEIVANVQASGAAQVVVEKVPAELVNQYGVADIAGVQLAPGEQAPIQQLVERPPVDQAPSDLAVVGRYVFPASLWELLEKTPVGAGNEIQLTDA